MGQMLLDKGADVDVKTSILPVFLSKLCLSLAVLDLRLVVEAVDQYGSTPLHQYGHSQKKHWPSFSGGKNKEPEKVGFFLIGLLRVLCT
jgi:hypothetical protein